MGFSFIDYHTLRGHWNRINCYGLLQCHQKLDQSRDNASYCNFVAIIDLTFSFDLFRFASRLYRPFRSDCKSIAQWVYNKHLCLAICSLLRNMKWKKSNTFNRNYLRHQSKWESRKKNTQSINNKWKSVLNFKLDICGKWWMRLMQYTYWTWLCIYVDWTVALLNLTSSFVPQFVVVHRLAISTIIATVRVCVYVLLKAIKAWNLTGNIAIVEMGRDEMRWEMRDEKRCNCG